MKMNEFLEFKFGLSDIDEIADDPMFRNMRWDTRSVVKMVIGSYKSGVENTMSIFTEPLDKEEAV